jgi:HPt (histidine-containing phosphotransfer) domain-containing protein
MTHSEDNSRQLAMDLPELLNRVDHDEDLLRELIGIFKEEFPRLLQVMREQIARGEMREVQLSGHALKGMLSGLSAKNAAAMAAEIEKMGRENEPAGLPEAVANLDDEVSRLILELDASLS